jgi:hypothetical protein
MTDRRQAFFQAVLHARNTLPHGQRPTDTHVRVAAKLSGWRARFPRHRQLAHAARCSVRTVRRALARLHELGLLSWARTVLTGPGWRAQIANDYAPLSSKPLSYQSLRTPAKLSACAALATSAAADLAAIAARRADLFAQEWARGRAGM